MCILGAKGTKKNPKRGEMEKERVEKKEEMNEMVMATKRGMMETKGKKELKVDMQVARGHVVWLIEETGMDRMGRPNLGLS